MQNRTAMKVACTVLVLALIGACSSSGTSATTKLPAQSCTGERVGTGAQAAEICRDGYGIPSIWAAAMPGVWYGTGWAQAEDRLVQMELVRRNARGTLSGLFGAFDPSTIDQDKQTLTSYYTDAELQQELAQLPQWIRDGLTNFVAGINAYVAHAYATPQSRAALVPLEFYAIGKLRNVAVYRPAPFTAIDVVANGNFLAREFGGGGGDELSNLQFLQYLQKRYGATEGYAIFNDARWIDDPNAPTTVPDGRPTYGHGGGPSNPAP
ncbi:MAG TPA: penicillin acylase family protein, partial [Acidimicrobiia bacterium]|nr:penicillin acylase family protein [Acidimicrobiia bacterium]